MRCSGALVAIILRIFYKHVLGHTGIKEEGCMLPEDVLVALRSSGLPEDEIGLRESLEAHAPGWELFRLTPAAAKRWKCRYRLLMGAGYYDGQTAAEAYARALLALVHPIEGRQ
jgi:hypothetical protein